MARNDGIDRTFARNQDLPTLDDVAKVQEHNEREKASYSNQDIDTAQTYRNIHFKAPTDSYAAMFDQMIADGIISTRGLKADAVKYGELIFDVNSAYFHNHGGYEYAKQFYTDAYKVYVLSRIQYWFHRAQLSEEKLLQQILKNGDRERMTAAKRQESELKRAEKRKAEVDGKFVRMYEDWSAGRITEYNFNLLTKKYQAEQLELEEKISRLQAELSAEQQTALDAEKWVALIKQYANPTELTAELLNTLIEKIVIHEATKGEDGIREQEIEIYYRFIGKID